MAAGQEFGAFFRSTLRMYQRAFHEAFRGARLNWWGACLPVGYVALMIPAAMICAPLGMPGGFILGFILACFIANYFALVQSCVLAEKVSWALLVQRSRELISPVISVMFTLWILQMFSEMAFRGSNAWLMVALNFVIVFLFNPLPEVIYQQGGNVSYLFGTSLSFMKENAVEWIAAWLLILSPIIATDPQEVFIAFASSGPFDFPRILIGHLLELTKGLPGLFSVPLFFVMMFATLYVAVFRGILFKELFHSTRRKRIYQERFQS